MEIIRFKVDGKPVELNMDAQTPLLWALREQLGLTGTKFGCGMALCGACTVQVNGNAVRSCLRFQPRFAVRFDYASGDSDRHSQNLNAFNPLFPNAAYFSISGLLGPTNLTDVGPVIRLTLSAKTAITPEMPFYWRSSIHDGIYNFALMLICPGNLSTARFVGYRPGAVLEHIFSPHFSSTAGYFFFFTGQFLHETPLTKAWAIAMSRLLSATES